MDWSKDHNHPVVRSAHWLFVALTIFIAMLTLAKIREYHFIGQGVTPQTVISVTGEGKAFAAPDIARFSYSVEETAKTVGEAQKKATAKANKISAEIKKAGVAEKDLKTTSYNISPKYEYENKVGGPVCMGYSCPPFEGKQVVVGYTVSQSNEVTVRSVDKAGELIAVVGGLEPQYVSGLSLLVEDDNAIRREARSEAIVEAKKKARELASDLGVKLVRVVNFQEGSMYGVYSAKAYGGGFMESASVAPEIAPGENQYNSNVTITYEIR
ncbi:MAG: SIMPL domain-containing protein [Patescibacteria group bacterium]|mgnify:FL=1